MAGPVIIMAQSERFYATPHNYDRMYMQLMLLLIQCVNTNMPYYYMKFTMTRNRARTGSD